MNSSFPVEVRIEHLLAQMTLEEKIAQMALVEKNSIDPKTVAAVGIGAVLSGGGGKPENNTPLGWHTMIMEFIEGSKSSRTGIPIFYGMDANHGLGNIPGATIFPHQIGLGATGNSQLVEEIARATAEESRAIGLQWNFSPALDLPTDIRWGRVYENFSDDPELTSTLGAMYVRGLHDGSVLASAKHFVGAGSMLWQTSHNKNFSIDQGITEADENRLRSEFLPPFRRAIEEGALNIMVGLNAWGDAKVTANHYLITDILKQELGFKGFIVSDWYGVYEISDSTYESTVSAIQAGVDMVMLPYDYRTFIADVRQAVRRGDIEEARIDDAVRRILRAKFEFGLFDADTQPPLSVIGSENHRALAREAVAQSLVVLKNNDVLPLSKKLRKIRVAGSAADNIGMQAGAWTVEWQGIDGNWLPGATSILAGIQDAVNDSTMIEFDKDGVFLEKDIADIGIAIVGEKPYAEGWGDTAHPKISTEDLEAIARLTASSREVVVILVSGRPLIISDELENWDALVAAWLPGSEGAGIADVIFGDATTGTLPITWPRTIEQLPISASGFTRDGTSPLFPRGFGLRFD